MSDLRTADPGSVWSDADMPSPLRGSSVQTLLQHAERLARQNRIPDAIAVLQPYRSLDSVPILVALGRLYLASRQPESARAVLERAVERAPAGPVPQEMLARALMDADQPLEALRVLQAVQARWPERVDAWVLAGDLFIRMQRYRDAEQVGAVLQRVSPRTHHGVRLLALSAAHRSKLEEAVGLLQRWLQQQPAAPEACCLLGELYSRVRRFAEADALFAIALRSGPLDVVGSTRHAHHLGRQGRFADALRHFADIARRDPNQAVHHANHGIALHWMGQLDAASRALQRAVAQAPNAPSHRLSWSHTLLQQGDFERGFCHYEARVEESGRPPWWDDRWKGEALPPETPLVLDAEQGLGDAIQFVRFARDAAQRGAKVVVRAHSRLLPLLSQATGVADTLASTTPVPAGVKRARLLSLARAVGVSHASDLGPRVPYLSVSPERREQWAARLEGSNLRVGIVWQGNPNFETDHLRSPPLSHFLPVAEIPGVKVYSLQKFHGVDQLERLDRAAHAIEDLGAELDLDVPFLDTAAAMLSLDLVLTSDTSIAHLAGALGVETWTVLPFAPDWRWPRKGVHCSWYPTMRLFHQHRPCDWSGVFADVVAALKVRLASVRSP